MLKLTMLKLTMASLGAALVFGAATFGSLNESRADDPTSTSQLPPAARSTQPQPATTDPVTGPPIRRGTAPNPSDAYWDDYWKWYDGEYRPYRTRYYGRTSTPAVEVERDRARSGLGSVRRSGPYHREHYLFYERDRRFNPNPFPGGGGNYNMVR